jgi:hypothetical protein
MPISSGAKALHSDWQAHPPYFAPAAGTIPQPTLVAISRRCWECPLPPPCWWGNIGDSQGTVGFYFHENKDKHGNPSDNVFAVTNHHVLCEDDNKLYDFRSNNSPQQQVRVCGSRRFHRGLDEIRKAIVHQGIEISRCVEEAARLEANGENGNPKALKRTQRALEDARDALFDFEHLHNDVSVGWADIAQRKIGVLDYSPAISVNTDDKSYTQDFATIRLDSSRFRDNFVGNQVSLLGAC